MIEVNSPQGLMVWLINFMADKFGNSAILKGGMELRLLDCPRQTNDLDYVFIPFSSKKEVSKIVVKALSEIPGMRVQHTMNSKCLRCICEYNSIKAQIEINIAKDCESQELSTASFSREHNQQGRIIRGMRFDIALAHKIAAWNERGLIRDLYDCAFMVHILDVKPDIDVLKRRLSKSLIREGRKTKKISMTLNELIQKLQNVGEILNQAKIEEQMRDYLTPEELPGLEKKIRIGLKKLEELLV
jgi:predicted nucleotidyltransferase component of viral defense system